MKEFVYLHCICTNVVDGDTLDCLVDVGFNFQTHQRLRLLGIDTPERNEIGFHEARGFVIEKCLNQPIQITTFEKDSFGRWLSIVYRNGENINELLLKNGLAIKY